MPAKFVHGDPLMVDHTPGSAVAVGDIVVSGGRCLVAHHDIAANQLGALAVPSGGAVYNLAGTTIAGGVTFAVGETVYVIDSTGVLHDTAASGRSVFGRVLSATGPLVQHVD
jgi:predicted RecA/RadA family phage recombinase